jgi:hypothetical protein
VQSRQADVSSRVPRIFDAVALLLLLLASLFVPASARADDAAPKPPDRRELWVPVDRLGHVLDKNAVLLTRDQYETLLRDAEREKSPKSEASVAAVISSAAYRAVPEGKTAVIRAELLVNVLRDGWCEVPLDFPGAAIGEVKLDGDGVLTPRNPVLRAGPPPQAAQQKAATERPALLLVRGRGEHRLTVELTAPVHVAGGMSTLALGVPSVAAGSFTLALSAGATIEQLGEAMRVSKTAAATTATVALSPSRNALAFAWKAGAENDGKIPVRAQALVRYDIDAEKIAGSHRIHLEAALGDLPLTFEFALPAGVKVLAVRAEELRGWEAANGKIVATFQEGARKELDLEIGVELQPLIGKDTAATVLPMPVLQGASRLDGVLQIAGADNVTIKDVSADARMRRMPTAEDRGERGFFGAYEFSGSGVAPKVVIERAVPGMESDLDTLVEFRSDAIFVTRTLTLREQKGRRFSAAITLPASEEFLDVRRIEEVKMPANQPAAQGVLPLHTAGGETEPEWTREGGKLLIKWSDEAAKPRVFRVRTRIEPEKWTQLPAEGISVTLGDAKIADSAKVTGYIALTADPAFRIEAQPGETLERRDGRSTPVQGEYAWFRRDAFDLTIQIARRPSEVLAALTGYALPLEGLLDVHAVMNYQFLGGGTRAVKIRVPKDLAQNFHFEGAQIAERALADDVWTVTFQKELTGTYALSIAAQVPVVKQAGENGGKGYSFAVKVPVISPLDVVRASGLWAVEANTETEIRFDAAGMNELDSLLAPQLADYAPRHRVIGVFGWLGADYALTLNGVRHAPAGMLAAVVDALELNTVISTSGTHRHEAIYRLRASGVEYFDVALPQGAALLSVAIDGTAVKPVADRPGSVRLPLPAKRDANTGVVASLVYETSGDEWKNRGKLALVAPSIAAGIPVLKSTWRVWVPEGFSFSDIESNLPVPEGAHEELLVRTIGRVSLGALLPHRRMLAMEREEVSSREDETKALAVTNGWARPVPAELPRQTSAPSTVAITGKLNSIIFPKIDFRDATVREAIEFLAAKSKSLDPEGQGVNIVLKFDDAEFGKTRITLTLNNVPLIEVIKYVTNLANLKYKIEPFAVSIVPIGTATEELFIKEWKVPPGLFRAAPESKTPTSGVAGADGPANAKDFLAASGVTFGQGAFAMYSPASSTLIVKGTQDQLDLVERIIEIGAADVQPGAAAAAKPQAGQSRDLQQVPQEATKADVGYFTKKGGGKTAGLLPVTLDLPKTGTALVFDGLYAPERLVMRYDDWWSRARALWIWFVAGGVAFYLLASRRPWWRTLWAVLVLSALPLCVSLAWMPVCNALLGGWLAGLVLNRIGAWCVFRVKKEVLA